MVDEDAVTRLHVFDSTYSLRIPDAVPDGFLIALEIVDRVDGRLRFGQVVVDRISVFHGGSEREISLINGSRAKRRMARTLYNTKWFAVRAARGNPRRNVVRGPH